MKLFLYCMAAILLISGCSKKRELSAEQTKFISEFKRQMFFPIKADSSFIARLDTLEAMEGSLLEKIRKDSLNTEFAPQLKNSINNCLFIENLMQRSLYSAYLDTLGAGMLKNALAFKIGKIRLKDESFLLLWGINESSSEATPGYSGISIFASYPNNKGTFTHMLVDERYTIAGISGYLAKTTVSEMTDKQIKITTSIKESNEETGSSINDNSTLTLQLKKGEVTKVQKEN